MPNPLVKAIVAFLAVLAFSSIALAQRGGPPPPGFVAAGVPKMPNPPGPAPKRDLSGAWVGPQNNKPDPVPPMTPAGEVQFKLRKPYGTATNLGSKSGEPGASNDPFITCD